MTKDLEFNNSFWDWWYQDQAWKELLETFRSWNSQIDNYLRSPDDSFPGLLRFDTDKLVLLLHQKGLDPIPVWNAYLIIESVAPTQLFSGMHYMAPKTLEEVAFAFNRTVMTYHLANRLGITDKKPKGKSGSLKGRGRKPSILVKERREYVKMLYEEGLSSEVIADQLARQGVRGMSINKVDKDVRLLKERGDLPTKTVAERRELVRQLSSNGSQPQAIATELKKQGFYRAKVVTVRNDLRWLANNT